MKKIIIIAVFILVGVVAVYVLNMPPKSLTESEKEAALIKILGRKPNLSDAPKGNKEYNGKYMFFTYPIRAKIYVQMLNGKPVKVDSLESFIFTIDEPKTRVYTEVNNASPTVKNINDFPAVRLREMQENIYSKTELEADNKNGIVFTKKDSRGSEKTVFFYLDSKIYSISVQSSDYVFMEELFSNIMDSLKLKS